MRHLNLIVLFSIVTTLTVVAQQPSPTSADRIVAVVNDQIILKSDIDQGVADYIRQANFNQQNIQFSKELWYSFLESEIDNKVLLEKAEIDSVVISDEDVNQQMDNRVSQLIQQAGSERALEEAFGKSIIQLKADFRDEFREQMTANQVRQIKFNDIKITRPEVKEFLNLFQKILFQQYLNKFLFLIS